MRTKLIKSSMPSIIHKVKQAIKIFMTKNKPLLCDGIRQGQTHIIFSDGQRISELLRVPLAVDTKICGVTLIQIIPLVFTAMDFFSFVQLFLGMTSSLKTNNQSWDQMTLRINISADNLDKPFENV